MKKATPEELNILKEHIQTRANKTETVSLTQYIIDRPHLIEELYHLIFTCDKKEQWKAAWLFEHVYLEDKTIIRPFLKDMIKRFPNLQSDGVKRHFSKMLAYSDINNLLDGNFINICFDWLISEKIPVAVKANCMHILYNATKVYPELKPELKMILEEQFDNNTAGFKSRAKKILKEIS
ncbi:hypothetical protein [Plebeiibacterium sediminum]|uniref:Adenylosuccinate lyase n=1 Tax=Plebeiibacterium sediminum TaxID=2992112 RepID=A0AAE3M5H7_9BACT|nr:hypothetical protein [Plebeiobacterium sediminum]MCW3787631.1 hypothetical protein [Plebeiobacterium sediminum]